MAFQVREKDSGRVLMARHRRKEAEADVEHLVDAHDYDEAELEIHDASEGD